MHKSLVQYLLCLSARVDSLFDKLPYDLCFTLLKVFGNFIVNAHKCFSFIDYYFSFFSSVLRGRYTLVGIKNMIEGGQILVTAHQRHVLDRDVGVLQQLAGVIHPCLAKILRKAFTRTLLEKLTQIGLAEV